MTPLQTLLPSQISKGMKASFETVISAQMLDQFALLSGDFNPLHHDTQYAIESGFRSRVAHGAIQQALISRLAGMHLPGRYCFIKKVSTQYLQPILEGEKVTVDGELIDWNPETPGGKLQVRISSSILKSISIVEIGLVGYPRTADPTPKFSSEAIHSPQFSSESKPILILGASSGLATNLIPELRDRGYPTIRVGRRSGYELELDLESDNLSSLVEMAQAKKAYAVIHFASQRPLKSLPSKLDIDYLCKDIKLHLRSIQVLAKASVNGDLPSLKRIILLGSAWARHLYPNKGYEAYGYAKQVAHHYMKDLARELASLEITVNTIAPSEIAVGMNAAMADRTQALLAAKIPSGRLTTYQDLLKTIELILSPGSVAITGQEIVLAGGRTQ